MKMNRMAALGLLIAAPLMAPAAHAEGLGAEVNYGRADGHWGTEIGAGYALAAIHVGTRTAPTAIHFAMRMRPAYHHRDARRCVRPLARAHANRTDDIRHVAIR